MIITNESIHDVISSNQEESEENTGSAGGKYFITRLKILAEDPSNGTIMTKTITLFSDEKLS